MSTIIADNLTGKTAAGNVTVTSEGGAATFQLQQGLAKSWGHFDPSADNTIDDSLNVASLTDNGAGNYDFNFSNSMSNVNYVAAGSAQRTSIWGTNNAGGSDSYTTSSINIYVTNTGGTAWDVLDVVTLVAGDLA